MEEFNLLDYLVPDIDVFSVVHNYNRRILRIELESEFPIIIGEKKKGNRPMAFNRYGSVLKEGRECLLFPSRDIRTWEGYVTPRVYKQGEIVKAIDPDGVRLVAVYSHFDKEKQLHYCFHSISSSGDIELQAYSQVDKMDKRNGYLFCKTIYSRQIIGTYRKKDNEPDNINVEEYVTRKED